MKNYCWPSQGSNHISSRQPPCTYSKNFQVRQKGFRSFSYFKRVSCFSSERHGDNGSELIHCNINLVVICNNSEVPSQSRDSYAKICKIFGVQQIPARALDLPNLLLLIISYEFRFWPLLPRQD